VGGDIFSRALTLALNSEAIRARSKLHARGFGGGLSKFEPNDLKTIPVPDLRLVTEDILMRLSLQLDRADTAARNDLNASRIEVETNALINEAVEQATALQTALF